MAEKCSLLWNIMTWCHHYQITLRARHIPGCLNVMSDLLSSPVSRMVNASTDVQTHLSSGSLLCRSICHPSEPQSSIIRISSPSPICLGLRCSKHKLIWSHCLCLPSHGSPSQGDPCQAILFHSNPQHLNLHAWCLGVDGSRDGASLWR